MAGDHILVTIKTLLFVSHNSWHFPCLDRVFVFSLDTIAYRTLNDANLCDITYHHKYNNSPATKSHTESLKVTRTFF